MENKAINTYLAEKNAIWASGTFENNTQSEAKIIERMFPDIPLSLLDAAQENLRKYTSMKNYPDTESADVTDPLVSNREMTGTYYGGQVRFEWGPPDPSRNETPTVNVIQVLYKAEDVTSYNKTRHDCQYKVEEIKYRFADEVPSLPSKEPSNGVFYRITQNRFDDRTGSWFVTIEKWTRLYQHLQKRIVDDNYREKVEEEQHSGAKWNSADERWENDSGTELDIPDESDSTNPIIRVDRSINSDCTGEIVVRWTTIKYLHIREYVRDDNAHQKVQEEQFIGCKQVNVGTEEAPDYEYQNDDGETLDIPEEHTNGNPTISVNVSPTRGAKHDVIVRKTTYKQYTNDSTQVSDEQTDERETITEVEDGDTEWKAQGDLSATVGEIESVGHEKTPTGKFNQTHDKQTIHYRHVERHTVSDNQHQKVEEEHHWACKRVNEGTVESPDYQYQDDDGTDLGVPESHSSGNPTIDVRVGKERAGKVDVTVRWTTYKQYTNNSTQVNDGSFVETETVTEIESGDTEWQAQYEKTDSVTGKTKSISHEKSPTGKFNQTEETREPQEVTATGDTTADGYSESKTVQRNGTAKLEADTQTQGVISEATNDPTDEGRFNSRKNTRTRNYQHVPKKSIEDNTNRDVEEEQHLGAKWVTDHWEDDDSNTLDVPTAKSDSNPSINVSYNKHTDGKTDIVIRWVTVYYRHTSENETDEDEAGVATQELFEGVRKDSGKYYEDDDLSTEITALNNDANPSPCVPGVYDDPLTTDTPAGRYDDTNKVKVTVNERPGANNTWDITVSRVYTKEKKYYYDLQGRHGTGYAWRGQNVETEPSATYDGASWSVTGITDPGLTGYHYFSTWDVNKNELGLWDYTLVATRVRYTGSSSSEPYEDFDGTMAIKIPEYATIDGTRYRRLLSGKLYIAGRDSMQDAMDAIGTLMSNDTDVSATEPNYDISESSQGKGQFHVVRGVHVENLDTSVGSDDPSDWQKDETGA